jgi:Uma2 family endonuclease
MTIITTQDPFLPPTETEDGKTLSRPEADEELRPISIHAIIIATRLAGRLDAFTGLHRLGTAICEGPFGLRPRSKRKWRPDVAFVSALKWPLEKPFPDTDPWPVVPDLAVEVISPNDLAEEVFAKVKEYLEAGVRLIWVIFPKLGWVHVYESLTQVRGLTVADNLEGGNVLPGFSLPLRELFPHPNTSNGEAEPEESIPEA